MLANLINEKIIDRDDRIAVGVSGGADSMLLLHVLLEKQKKLDFHLTVIHVNHNLRGLESDGDALFVKNFCEINKVDFDIVNVDVNKMKASGKYTLEESARIARYDAFKKIMKSKKLNKLFLAHHKNDQAETILMHIFRGSGISGACGITDDSKTFRPLLNLTKNEVLKIVKKNQIEFVEDSTNSDIKYSRNYIRNVVIPSIEKVYPGVVDALFRFGEKCKDAQNFIEKHIKNDYFEEEDGVLLLKDAIFEEDKIVSIEYVKYAFKKLGIFSDIENKHYELIFSLRDFEVNKSVDLPHKIQAKRTYSGIKFIKKQKTVENLKEFQFVIGEIDFESFGKIKTSFVAPSEVVYGDGNIYVDQQKISKDAVWRARKFGDVFAKLGTGSKKLNDYFTDKKIDFDKRDLLPVLASKSQILVVAGFDVSENVKVDGKTDQIVKIEFVPSINS